jgi:hypothetical protein
VFFPLEVCGGVAPSLSPPPTAQTHLRKTDNFSWEIIPLIGFVLHIYSAEIRAKNWDRILAALAFLSLDWFNEVRRKKERGEGFHRV